MQVALVLVGWLLVLAVVFGFGRRWLERRQSRERVLEDVDSTAAATAADPLDEQALLGHWLYLAGFRAPGAVIGFISLEVIALGVGLVLAYVLISSGLVERSSHLLAAIPGAIDDLFHALVLASPWIILAVLVALPWLVVYDARKRRVVHVEQDLPIVLELLSTLSEAGLGFDAALDRVLTAQPADRVLTREFRTFQGEVLAGRSRVQCLRRLSRRVELPTLSIFVSALVQAEQVGSGVADVLRTQAEDLRGRRRERALTLASSLPVKMLFPLIVCFLPAIFVLTLGPILLQFIQMADTFMRHPGAH